MQMLVTQTGIEAQPLPSQGDSIFSSSFFPYLPPFLFPPPSAPTVLHFWLSLFWQSVLGTELKEGDLLTAPSLPSL